MEILSFSSFGYEGEIIKVEADLRRGLPVTDIVGLPGSAVKEARERVRAAIRNSELNFPQGRILINLSPADQKKEGSAFDLPIALAILTAKESGKDESNTKNRFKPQDCELRESGEDLRIMVMGELELSGAVRPVHGILGAISSGTDSGIQYFIVPKENEKEASILENTEVFGASTLIEALNCFCSIRDGFYNETLKKPYVRPFSDGTSIKIPEFIWSNDNGEEDENFHSSEPKVLTCGAANLKECNSQNHSLNAESDLKPSAAEGFEDIRGQDKLVRSLEIAAAGGHNLIAYGPPGCGKTLSLRRFKFLLPDMDKQTAREATRIYSTAGLLPSGHGKDVLLKRPPFRMPHQNASLEGMIGGAGKCMPGEVSLAHGGTLFLDEASQFKGSVLQTLRAPLETGTVTLSRAGKSSTFPARFQLLLAINPCPCGNLGAKGKVCTCMPAEIERYWKKLTAPLLDRLDIRIPVFPPPPESLLKPVKYSTEKMRQNIKNAKIIQLKRIMTIRKLKKINGPIYWNSKLLPQDIPSVCLMTEEAEKTFSLFAKTKKLSGRGSHAILRISRTIADMESSEKISVSHIEEAISLRQWANYLPDF